MLKISLGTLTDKKKVLKFCANTFSWGDYIAHVWDFWVREGNLLVLREKNIPVAICHASFLPGTQVWIEGIRVNPIFRRRGFAETLVKESEILGGKNNCNVSFMLIEDTNFPSLSLAKKLNYEIFENWVLYSMIPKKIDHAKEVDFPNIEKKNPPKLFSEELFYVQSWRWIPLNKSTLPKLIAKKRIFFSDKQKTPSIAIMTDSDHFDSTMIITLYSDSGHGITEILNHIKNFAFKNNYQRIQILTKSGNLYNLNDLEKKISFHLMRKKLKIDF